MNNGLSFALFLHCRTVEKGARLTQSMCELLYVLLCYFIAETLRMHRSAHPCLKIKTLRFALWPVWKWYARVVLGHYFQSRSVSLSWSWRCVYLISFTRMDTLNGLLCIAWHKVYFSAIRLLNCRSSFPIYKFACAFRLGGLPLRSPAHSYIWVCNFGFTGAIMLFYFLSLGPQ